MNHIYDFLLIKLDLKEKVEFSNTLIIHGFGGWNFAGDITLNHINDFLLIKLDLSPSKHPTGHGDQNRPSKFFWDFESSWWLRNGAPKKNCTSIVNEWKDLQIRELHQYRTSKFYSAKLVNWLSFYLKNFRKKSGFSHFLWFAYCRVSSKETQWVLFEFICTLWV